MSFRRTLLASIALTFFIQSFSCLAKEPQNIVITKQQLMHYHDSGEYEKDQAAVIAKAMNYLKKQLATKSPSEKLAIVLDIDETSLSNYADMVTLDFGGTLNEIIVAEGKGTDSVIAPMLALYRFAKANQVAVFFITGRTERFREATARNLKQTGYSNWDGLILKPENYHEKSAAPYKIAERKKITEQGYRIVLNIGDQQSDLSGGYAEKPLKLPNPYYIVP